MGRKVDGIIYSAPYNQPYWTLFNSTRIYYGVIAVRAVVYDYGGRDFVFSVGLDRMTLFSYTIG